MTTIAVGPELEQELDALKGKFPVILFL